MRVSLTVLLIGSLTLSACSAWRESRVNPSNWFGGPEPVSVNVDSEGAVNPLLPSEDDRLGLFDRPEPVDTSVPITKLTTMRVEKTNSGAIIYVTGVAQRQGAFDAFMRRNRSEENTKNGVLSYTFRVTYPEGATLQGDEASRTIHDAITVSNETLEGIRLIRVTAEQNALESRRR
ncbi:hypothetical protein Q5Y75_04150 [Ruegeria sp. 2205SS24-7]|uniref:hypothetical protein n=1 Tax=Ruegeria discodermiae TaxID=3064389 RepID=UPI002741136A|nr:hypothetical protein [Ruegeria sp. 2205SS24-7]MDP5216402.1 hypothetical protein [Ruegeria sp. 2205SS24-7]